MGGLAEEEHDGKSDPDENGDVKVPNQIIAKVSRIEIARQFFSPPPEKLLNDLVAQGRITQKEAQLAARIPMAYDLVCRFNSLLAS